METIKNSILVSFMPDGKGGMQPTPDLLTLEEAARYLRLDTIKTKHPGETLRRYRAEYGLRAVQVGKQVLFPQAELQKFIKQRMEINPR